MIESLEEILDRLRNVCILCKADKRDPNWIPCVACKPLPKYPEKAPEGQIFVCGACGKSRKNLYPQGFEDSWDESCMLNAILCYEESIVRDPCGRITSCNAVEGY